MEFYKFFPTPSDRMGTIWTLSTIEDAYIIEFGPAGTTHFAIEGMMQLNAEHKANVYTTHINETDISFGKQDRLENAILEVDGQYNPKYIFVMASSISAIIGTDIASICYEMQTQIKAKLIPIDTGGYNGDYTLGVERSLDMLCQEIVQPSTRRKLKTYNIIGNNADLYNFLSDAVEIKALMKNGFNYEANTVFTAYTSIEDIENTTEAEFNLVIRGEGIKAAKGLEKKYKMEYYYGRPYGLEGTTMWLRNIGRIINKDVNENYILENTGKIRMYLMNYRFMTREMENKSVILVGDYDITIGLANLVEEMGLNVDAILLKHKLTKEVKRNISSKWESKIKSDLKERDIEDYLKSTQSYLLLADEATLKLENKSKLFMQIANPNFSKYNIYPYNPFLGYNGMLYMIQSLFELERSSLKY